MERDIKALFEEFWPTQEDIQRGLKAEYDRRHALGETVREGEASHAVAEKWLEQYGMVFCEALRRRSGYKDD